MLFLLVCWHYVLYDPLNSMLHLSIWQRSCSGNWMPGSLPQIRICNLPWMGGLPQIHQSCSSPRTRSLPRRNSLGMSRRNSKQHVFRFDTLYIIWQSDKEYMYNIYIYVINFKGLNNSWWSMCMLFEVSVLYKFRNEWHFMAGQTIYVKALRFCEQDLFLQFLVLFVCPSCVFFPLFNQMESNTQWGRTTIWQQTQWWWANLLLGSSTRSWDGLPRSWSATLSAVLVLCKPSRLQ